MKKIVTTVTLFFVVAHTFAQEKRAISADFLSTITFITFKNNEFVAPKKRNRTTIGDELAFNIMYQFPIAKNGVELKTGLGFASREMAMRKSGGFVDFFVSIFPFGNPARDSFRLRSVYFRPTYINVPVSFTFPLGNKGNKSQVRAGIQLNNSFLAGKKIIANFDSTYLIPTQTEVAEAKKKYAQTLNGYSLSIQPRVDFDLHIAERLSLQFNAIPFLYYVNSWATPIMRNGFAFSFNMGVGFKF